MLLGHACCLLGPLGDLETGSWPRRIVKFLEMYFKTNVLFSSLIPACLDTPSVFQQ